MNIPGESTIPDPLLSEANRRAHRIVSVLLAMRDDVPYCFSDQHYGEESPNPRFSPSELDIALDAYEEIEQRRMKEATL